MNTALDNNIVITPWPSPQMVGYTANQIQGVNQPAFAATIDVNEFFINLQLPVSIPYKNVMHIVAAANKPAPRVSFARLAFFGVFMVLLLPLFLIIGRNDTP